LYINGVYAQNTLAIAASSEKGTFDTKGLLIGPEVRYTFNNALEFRGFYGYAVSVSQKEKLEVFSEGTGTLDADGESMTILNLKLTYFFTEHWAACMGYRAKEIKSGVAYSASTHQNYTDKQDMLTVGAIYHF